MKIQYTGKARARVEGIGEFGPGETREVADRIGMELYRTGEFREATPSPEKASRRDAEEKERKEESPSKTQRRKEKTGEKSLEHTAETPAEQEE